MRLLCVLTILMNAWIAYASDESGLIFGTVREAWSGKVISGAMVRLLIVNQICPEKEILTDENGQFFFSTLPLGRYRVDVTRNGFVRNVYGETNENPLGQELILTGITSQQQIDFQLVESAAISGHVYDTEGQPVKDSPVVFESVSIDNRIFRAFTDQLGYFYASDLPADLYKISARKYHGSKKGTGEKWYYPSSLEEKNSEAIELQAGKTAVVDIRFGIVPQPAWIGKVVGPDREAIANADLTFLRSENSRLVPLAACRTVEDGTCSVRSLPPGKYRVFVTQVPAPYTTWLRNETSENNNERFAKDLTVETGKLATTEFHLKKGIPVQVKIYMGNGAPAALETGIQVTLTHYWEISNYKLPLNASTFHRSADTREFYVHSGLAYQFQVDQQDPKSNFSVVRVEWNDAPLANPIQFAKESAAQLEIWVDQSSTISGVARQAKVIFAERLGPDLEKENYYSPSLFHTTVQQGNFLLRALPPGTYRIRQNKRDGPFVEVTVAAGESKTVELR